MPGALRSAQLEVALSTLLSKEKICVHSSANKDRTTSGHQVNSFVHSTSASGTLVGIRFMVHDSRHKWLIHSKNFRRELESWERGLFWSVEGSTGVVVSVRGLEMFTDYPSWIMGGVCVVTHTWPHCVHSPALSCAWYVCRKKTGTWCTYCSVFLYINTDRDLNGKTSMVVPGMHMMTVIMTSTGYNLIHCLSWTDGYIYIFTTEGKEKCTHKNKQREDDITARHQVRLHVKKRHHPGGTM